MFRAQKKYFAPTVIPQITFLGKETDYWKIKGWGSWQNVPFNRSGCLIQDLIGVLDQSRTNGTSEEDKIYKRIYYYKGVVKFTMIIFKSCGNVVYLALKILLL
jgi:hypothetical protein